MNEQISKEKLNDLLGAMRTNTRVSSPKSWASSTGVPVEVIVNLIGYIKTVDYAKIDTFPSGKFKTYHLTCFGSIFFINGFKVYVNGRHEVSLSLSDAYRYPVWRQHTLDQHRTNAIKMGIPFAHGFESLRSIFLDRVYNHLNAEFIKYTEESNVKAAEDAKYKIFAGYDCALELYKNTETEIVLFQQQLKKLQENDDSKLKEYTHQKLLADTWKRTKQVSYYTIVGYEDAFISSGFVPIRYSDGEFVETGYLGKKPVYELRYRTDQDFPHEPKYDTEQIREVSDKLVKLEFTLRYIENNFVHVDRLIKELNLNELNHLAYLKEHIAIGEKYKIC